MPTYWLKIDYEPLVEELDPTGPQGHTAQRNQTFMSERILMNYGVSGNNGIPPKHLLHSQVKVLKFQERSFILTVRHTLTGHLVENFPVFTG